MIRDGKNEDQIKSENGFSGSSSLTLVRNSADFESSAEGVGRRGRQVKGLSSVS